MSNALQCGQISGRLTLYMIHPMIFFFVRDLNQDTATTGGFLQYGTTPIAGIQVGISYEGQWA